MLLYTALPFIIYSHGCIIPAFHKQNEHFNVCCQMWYRRLNRNKQKTKTNKQKTKDFLNPLARDQ